LEEDTQDQQMACTAGILLEVLSRVWYLFYTYWDSYCKNYMLQPLHSTLLIVYISLLPACSIMLCSPQSSKDTVFLWTGTAALNSWSANILEWELKRRSMLIGSMEHWPRQIPTFLQLHRDWVSKSC